MASARIIRKEFDYFLILVGHIACKKANEILVEI